VNDPVGKQVALKDVKKNPFVMPEVEKPVETIVAPATSKAAAKPVRNRVAELTRELSTLKLQTVMQGRHPMAIVNNEIVKPGQKLGSFTVTVIADRTVRLSSEGHEFVLGMQE